MKKILALILAMTIMVFSLASCAQKGGSQTEPDRGETGGSADTGGEKDEDNGPEETEPEGGETNSESPSRPVEKPFIEGGEITETVLFNEMDVRITATKLEYSRSGAEVTLLLENNTDKTLRFLSGTISYSANSVNGWMVESGYLNATVASGKKSFETVRIDESDLAMLGITEIADISLAIDIKDDSYNTYVRTGPMRVETSLASTYDYSTDTYRGAIDGIFPEAYEMELLTVDESANYDHHGVRVLSQALLRNKSGNYLILTELENTSVDDVILFSQDFGVNGLLLEASRWSSNTILAGKRAVMSSNLSDMVDANVWQLLDFGEISTVSYALGIEDTEYNDLMAAEPLSFSVPGVTGSFDISGTEIYNNNGIRILYKGFVEDGWELSNDIHLVLLVENSTDEKITVDDDWNTMSINGFMTDCSIYGASFLAKYTGVMDVELSEYLLEKININSIDDIIDLEVTLDIRNENYKQIDKPTIKVER